jgi:ABC-type oligopeptide transport system substrate-binding subunit
MTRISAFRSLAVALGAVSMVAACGGGTQQTGENLASDQTLSFPMVDNPGNLDPAQMSAAVDIDVFRNVYSGLYKFDNSLNEVPDIADGQPVVSSDGLTYTFKMKQNVKFSNGDPVKSDDFIFSWNRAAAMQGDYASVFAPVVGYDDVAAGKATQMTGLKKIDDYSFSATISAPAAFWFTEVALWTAWVVDQKVVLAAGKATDNAWASNPATAVGTGPFKMSAYTPKQSIDFVPVSGWYGGSTGAITKVHIEIVADQKAQLTKYESNGYSLIGFANQSLTPEDVIRYSSDPQLKQQLTLQPAARTTWLGFNMCTAGNQSKDCAGKPSSPFAGSAGKPLRQAFSMAIDRAQLADIACSKATTCIPATGGVITKGLKGYTGDNTDPNTKFDKTQAQALLKQGDPDGSKTKNMTYTYNATAFNKAVCDNLSSQWKNNLGVTVQCTSTDTPSFFNARTHCNVKYVYRHSWGADYDHPQDWFDFLFKTNGGSNGTCYTNPQLDQTMADANTKPLDQSLDTYKQMGMTLINDCVTGTLFYGIQQYLVHPYVKGAGGNPLYDNYWTGLKILQH